MTDISTISDHESETWDLSIVESKTAILQSKGLEFYNAFTSHDRESYQ